MLKCGLVSVSFRDKSVDEIIKYTKQAGLQAIEWGSDIHVPFGNIELAKDVKEKTEKAGLTVSSYGSYFRFGVPENTDEIWQSYLNTALALGCSVIRVWCGNQGSREISVEEYDLAVEQAKRYCQMAEKSGITVTMECHNYTITDDYDSTLKFLKDVSCSNLKMYWQPNQFRADDYNIDSLNALLDYIVNIHVFYWIGKEKFPLSDGYTIWKKYVEICKNENKDYYFLLEFMHDNKIESLNMTAKTLKKLIK